jgi:dihydrofolate reductase
MRKIILFMVISLDGFVGGPNGELDWEKQDPEIGSYLIKDFLNTVDSMILGRVLYQGFEQYWPAAAENAKFPKELTDFAHWVNTSPKYVISKTLENVESKNNWTHSTLLKVKNDDDLVREVYTLKQQKAGDIVLFGGARMAQSLVRLGLVDEYRFKIQPVALGHGLPLFNGLKERLNLKLIKSKIFDAGVVAAYYKPI